MFGIGFGAVQALGAAGQLASGIMSAGSRRAEFDEQLRQLSRKKDYTLSLTSAIAGASGVEAGSVSTTEYLKSMTQEFDTELGFLRNTRNDTYMADLLGAGFGAVGAGVGIGSGLAKLNNWGGMGVKP